jgi:hypothetical protein
VTSSHTFRSIAAGAGAIVLFAALPRSADAQARPRPPVRHVANPPVVAVGGTWGPRYVFYGYYPWAGWGYPHYPYAWGYPYGWGYPNPWGFGLSFSFAWGGPHGFYGPYPAYPYPGYGYALDASLRVDVSDRDAEVFVDGYRAGTVDDFDGRYQRLHMSPGGHEITIYRQGFRTIRENVYVGAGASRTIRYTMEALPPGETAELPPSPTAREANRGEQAPEYLTERDRRTEPPQRPEREAVARFGSLSLRVQPIDAEIFIDGLKWGAPADAPGDRTLIRLAEGRHRIEVRKAGYATYAEDVLIRNNATLTLNFVLTK